MFLLYIMLLYLFIYLLDYGILYIQPMSLACICKHVTNLYLDGFRYSVMYTYIRELHAMYIYILFFN